MKLKGLVLFRQIGSARAFAQWMQDPKTQELFEIQVFDGDHAPEDWSEFDFLFMGTSLKSREDEVWIKKARQENIPSIAFIDQWINYRERFNEIYPDFVFVLDDRAQKSFHKETDFPLEKIIISGTPALNEVSNLQTEPSLNAKKIYFVTEPTTSSYYQRHGINDLESLGHALSHYKDHLTIALHPTDSQTRIQSFIQEKFPAAISRVSIIPSDKIEIFSQARCLLGMRSFMLFEASLLGIPCGSIQIDRKTNSDLTDDRKNIYVLTQPDECRSFLNLIPPRTKKEQIPKDSWNVALQRILKI